MEQAEIYLDLSNEIRELLDDEEIALQELLAEEGINVTVKPASIPGGDTRDVVPLLDIAALIASGSLGVATLSGAIAVISTAISNFLDRKKRRELLRYAETETLTAVRDKEGNPVKNDKGEFEYERGVSQTYIAPELPEPNNVSLEAGDKKVIVRLGGQPGK
ncbi:MAG: hypothetical protein GY862_16500 [Gammaproteobacteria bacterium]|nr:hypothetical protein [Gammaproteobacteria bacterium]